MLLSTIYSCKDLQFLKKTINFGIFLLCICGFHIAEVNTVFGKDDYSINSSIVNYEKKEYIPVIIEVYRDENILEQYYNKYLKKKNNNNSERNNINNYDYGIDNVDRDLLSLLSESFNNEYIQIEQLQYIDFIKPVLLDIKDNKYYNIKLYKNYPFLAVAISESIINKLIANPIVKGIYPDIILETQLDKTLPHIGVDNIHNHPETPYTGDGTLIAILDTGMDTNHAFFEGRIVNEACFSTTWGEYGSQTLCPDGENPLGNDYQFGPGAGMDCQGISGCGHGTRVGGIAAGKKYEGSSFDANGVAPDAGIITIQVFSNFDNQVALSWSSDQLRALDWLYTISTQNPNLNIVSANMSLGGGKYDSVCDEVIPPYTQAVNKLRSVNIATVIASGNASYSDGFAYPACISSAISTGSTRIRESETPPDAVSTFSNSASFLDLLAPGQSVRSSRFGGGYTTGSGTSFAAPHVTGAWALIREAHPGASVEEVLHRLATTGVLVTDSKNGLQKPRIQVDQALYNYIVPETETIEVVLGGTPAVYDSFAEFTNYLLEQKGNNTGHNPVVAHINSDVTISTNTHIRMVHDQESDYQPSTRIHLTSGNTLTIEPWASLIIGSNSVFVADTGSEIENKGTLEVASDALFNNQSLSDPQLTVRRVFLNGEGWRFVTAPVSGLTLEQFLDPIWTQGVSSGGNTSNGQPNVYRWNQEQSGNNSEDWEPVTNLTETEIAAGDGFLVYVFKEDNTGEDPGWFYKLLTVSGKENPQTIVTTNSADEESWTLLGNPFATSIRFADLHASADPAGGINGSVYVWVPESYENDGEENGIESGSWLSYTLNGEIGDLENGLIAPFQAFFVQNNQMNGNGGGGISEHIQSFNGVNLDFSTNVKISDIFNTKFLFKQEERNYVRLELTGSSMKNSTWLQFSTSGTSDMFTSGDAHQLLPFAEDYVILATRKRDGTLLDIAHYPFSVSNGFETGLVAGLQEIGKFDGYQTFTQIELADYLDEDHLFRQHANDVIDIPLVYEVSHPGRYTLNVTDMNLKPQHNLFLYDLEKRKRLQLTEGVSYHFIHRENTRNTDAYEDGLFSDGSFSSVNSEDVAEKPGKRKSPVFVSGDEPELPFVPPDPFRLFETRPKNKGDNDPTRFVLRLLHMNTGTSMLTETPLDVRLHQNYPNPFNPTTVIRYSIPDNTKVQLYVYNLIGQRVVTLVDGYRDTGHYEVTWDAAGLSSGTYLYLLHAGGKSKTKAMTYIK